MPIDGRNHNSVVTMDNASIHKVEEVVELLTSVGVLIRFLPAISPDLNSIEEVFAEVKQYLQAISSLLNTTIII